MPDSIVWGIFLGLQSSASTPWAELPQSDYCWESKCNSGATNHSLAELEERTELAICCGCLWQAVSFFLFMRPSPQHLIFPNAFTIYNCSCNSYPPCNKMFLCLNMTRRSCVRGREVGDYLPVSAMATREHAGFSPSAGTVEQSSVSLPIC